MPELPPQAPLFDTEEDYTEEQRGFGHWFFAQPCTFLLSVTSMDNLPPAQAKEVAFAGRSNVGKSSLLNALTSQKGLARSSTQPGRTQQLNFFSIGSEEDEKEHLVLVDLPGYGYAKASKKSIKEWTRLTQDYLRGRPTLFRVILLIDSRHGVKSSDEELMSTLDKMAAPYQIVLTKSDKLKRGEAEKVFAKTKQAIAKHPAAHPKLFIVSSEKGTGMAELRAELGMLTEQ